MYSPPEDNDPRGMILFEKDFSFLNNIPQQMPIQRRILQNNNGGDRIYMSQRDDNSYNSNNRMYDFPLHQNANIQYSSNYNSQYNQKVANNNVGQENYIVEGRGYNSIGEGRGYNSIGEVSNMI